MKPRDNIIRKTKKRGDPPKKKGYLDNKTSRLIASKSFTQFLNKLGPIGEVLAQKNDNWRKWNLNDPQKI